MPSWNSFTFSRDGVPPDASYPGAIAITRGADSTAQYLVLVRSATRAWGVGMLPNSSVFAIGLANALDANFQGVFNLDDKGRLLLGRSGAPSTGLIAEFYSDPNAAGAVGLPVWNGPTEQGGVTLQAGAFGYQAQDGTLQYHTNLVWKVLANVDQIITNHASLTGLGGDDHQGYLWMTGRQFAQLITGGTQAGADLIVTTTSHNTKGLFQIGTLTYDEQARRLGLGISNPQYGLDVQTDARFSVSMNGIPRLTQGVLAVTTGLDVGPNGALGINQAPDNTRRTIGITNTPLVLAGFGSAPPMELTALTGIATGVSPTGYIPVLDRGVVRYLRLWDQPSGSAPTAPSSVTATVASSSQINLAWTDNSNNEDTFRIERSSPTNGSFAEINNVGPGVVNFSDSGLTASTAYYYRVRARNTFGDSAYANATPAPATTQAAGGSAIMDDFNKGNGTPLGIPHGGNTSINWTYYGNKADDLAWSIVNNTYAAQQTAGAGNNEWLACTLSGQGATGTIKITMAALGGSTGVGIFRFNSTNRTGYVLTNGFASQWRVYYVDFTKTVLTGGFFANFQAGLVNSSTSTSPTPGETDVLEIVLASGNASVGFRVNGATMNNVSCPNNLTSAEHGLYSDRVDVTTLNAMRWNAYEWA